MKRRNFIKSLSSIMAILTGRQAFSLTQFSETLSAKSISNNLHSNVSIYDESSISVQVIAVGMAAGRVLNQLKKNGFNQYDDSVEPEFSFVDAYYTDNVYKFHWQHELSDDLQWHNYEQVNEAKAKSWERYGHNHSFFQFAIRNDLRYKELDSETAERLAKSSIFSEAKTNHDCHADGFIESNNKFNENQIVIFIYDVSDQAARRLIKPLLVNAKKNDVHTTFAISLRSYIPNLPGSNPELFREMYHYSRIGERYADYTQQFVGRVDKKYTGGNIFVNNWVTENMDADNIDSKIKSIIDVMVSLARPSGFISAEICDFNTVFKGYGSSGFKITTHEDNISQPIEKVVDNICDHHPIRSVKPVMNMLVHVVTGDSISLNYVEDITTLLHDKYGYLSIVLHTKSNSIARNKVQVTFMSV